MRVFGMLTALEAVRNRMYANFERGVTTWLYIDEVQSLFGHPAIISYFSKFWAEGRKFNLIATGITQNSTYMLEHEDARNMVLNSDFVLLHKQSALDRKSWVDLLSLSATEAGLHRRHHQGRRRAARGRRGAGPHPRRLPEGRALRSVQHEGHRDRRAEAQAAPRGSRPMSAGIREVVTSEKADLLNTGTVKDAEGQSASTLAQRETAATQRQAAARRSRLRQVRGGQTRQV